MVRQERANDALIVKLASSPVGRVMSKPKKDALTLCIASDDGRF